MRIAILSWESLHSVSVGGVAVHVTELGAALARKGHQVHIFTRRLPGQRGHDCMKGVHYHRCTYLPHNDFVDDVNNMCRSFVDRVFEVEDFIGRFDLIHAHDWLSANAMIWIKQERGHNCVLTIHATEYARCGNAFPQGRSSRIRHQERAGTYWADRVIAVSQTTKNELMWMYEVPDWKISVVYNGVNPLRFDLATDPGVDKRRYDIGPMDPTVLFCGRLAWQKGPDLLVEAIPSILRLHGRSKFVFVGDGDMRAGLEARVRQLGVAHATRFLGRRDGQELIRLFKLADVICVPSRNEPFGIVVLEAWSARKPVVVTQVGGPSEYVWHEVNGLRTEPNPSSVAWGLGTVFSDFDRARWMGRNGRKAVEDCFTWDMIVEQTLAAYREVCPSGQLQLALSAEGTSRALQGGAVANEAQPLELLAKLRLGVSQDGDGATQTLASYKERLAQIGLHPEQENGSIILKGKFATLLAAIERCHQQIHQTGLNHVACSLDLETSVGFPQSEVAPSAAGRACPELAEGVPARQAALQKANKNPDLVTETHCKDANSETGKNREK